MGIILDADKDNEVSALDRYAAIKSRMAAIGLSIPDEAGTVVGVPRIGAFVLPDNANSGTLEDLLIECAESAYPNLLASAKLHVATADNDGSLKKEDLKDFQKPSGRTKAVVSTIASILRPGKAVQASIQDNRWLRGDSLKISRIAVVQEFLKKLFDLEPTPPEAA